MKSVKWNVVDHVAQTTSNFEVTKHPDGDNMQGGETLMAFTTISKQ